MPTYWFSLNDFFEAVKGKATNELETFFADPSPQLFRALEQNLLSHMTEICSDIMFEVTRVCVKAFDQAETLNLRDSSSHEKKGFQNTRVRFMSGKAYSLPACYQRSKRVNKRGRRRRTGNRGKAGQGRYLALEALGFVHSASPALTDMVSKESVRSSSFEEARDTLLDRGCHLDVKTVRNIMTDFGKIALDMRNERLAAAKANQQYSDELKGLTVVIGTDGGRINLREGSNRGRKRAKTGRRGFTAAWREPKLVTAYAVDETGEMDHSFNSIYDATLGNADDAFAILTAELKLRGASLSESLTMIADGAKWIVNRVKPLAKSLGIPHKKIRFIADFYHAAEHLTKIADLIWKNPRSKERKGWLKSMRKLLKYGKTEKILSECQRFCRGRRAAKVSTEMAYFRDRKKYMKYQDFKNLGLPCGSGATESAVRRVINQRIKGCGTFWLRDIAEIVLHLRSYFKAGRWEELVARVINRHPNGEVNENYWKFTKFATIEEAA